MDESTAAVTVNVVESVSVVTGSVAVIVIMPPANEVASPLKPAALSMVATAASEELQVTEEVRSCVVASEYVPVAINC